MTGHRLPIRPQHVILGLAAIGAAACAGILGIQDRSLDPLGSDGSTAEGGQDGGFSDAPGTDAPSSADGTGPGADASTGNDASTMDSSSDAPVVTPDAPSCADPCPLASGLNHPFLMTSDTNNVYWTEYGDTLGAGNGSVKGCPVRGCGAGPTIYGSGLTNPRGVAVDGTNIYFGTATYGGVTGGIWSCALSGCGGSPTRLTPAVIPYGVAVDSMYVYWVDNDDGTVHKVAKTGGGGIVLYDGGTFGDAGDYVGSAEQCILDGLFLYFMDAYDGTRRIATSGGDPIIIGMSQGGGSFGITVDPANVFFGSSGQVLRVGKAMINPAVPISDTIAGPYGLVFDPASTMIYWSNWGSGNANDGTVGRMATDGGGQRNLATALVTPEAVTVSGSYALWISNGTLTSTGATVASTGALWRTTK